MEEMTFDPALKLWIVICTFLRKKDAFLNFLLPLTDCACSWLLALAMDAKLYRDKEEKEIKGILLEMSHFIEESWEWKKRRKRSKNICLILFLHIERTISSYRKATLGYIPTLDMLVILKECDNCIIIKQCHPRVKLLQ